MDIPSDALLAKTMLDVGSCYLKLVKEFVVRLPISFLFLIFDVKNDGIAFGLLNFS